jgi:hypothetical protein
MIESFSQLALSSPIPVFRRELNNYGLSRFSFEQAEKSPNLGFLSNSFRPSAMCYDNLWFWGVFGEVRSDMGSKAIPCSSMWSDHLWFWGVLNEVRWDRKSEMGRSDLRRYVVKESDDLGLLKSARWGLFKHVARCEATCPEMIWLFAILMSVRWNAFRHEKFGRLDQRIMWGEGKLISWPRRRGNVSNAWIFRLLDGP